MAIANGCNIPEDLYYLVDKHVWVRYESDSLVTVGITDVAQHMAGKVIAVSPKKVGKALTKGQSAGTVESGKWVGPVQVPVNGELVAVNDALKTNPGLINQVGLMRSKKEQETRPPKRLQDEHCGSVDEQQWWKIQHGEAN